MLFQEPVFGPIHSRRFGASLGVNLLPPNVKVCSFECVYCECGFATAHGQARVPSRSEIRTLLEKKLQELRASNAAVDVITFAGNGEPTLHPHFAEIIDDTLAARNQFFPSAKVTVLSNATRAHNPQVHQALLRIDNNVLKLDSAIESTVKLINQPNSPDFSLPKIIDELAVFDNVVVQTLFLRGDYKGQHFDNTTEVEIAAWLDALKKIQPKQVMIYSLDRTPSVETLQRVDLQELEEISTQVQQLGFDTLVTQ